MTLLPKPNVALTTKPVVVLKNLKQISGYKTLVYSTKLQIYTYNNDLVESDWACLVVNSLFIYLLLHCSLLINKLNGIISDNLIISLGSDWLRFVIITHYKIVFCFKGCTMENCMY